jgi:hypothetical protein
MTTYKNRFRTAVQSFIGLLCLCAGLIHAQPISFPAKRIATLDGYWHLSAVSDSSSEFTLWRSRNLTTQSALHARFNRAGTFELLGENPDREPAFLSSVFLEHTCAPTIGDACRNQPISTWELRNWRDTMPRIKFFRDAQQQIRGIAFDSQNVWIAIADNPSLPVRTVLHRVNRISASIQESRELPRHVLDIAIRNGELGLIAVDQRSDGQSGLFFERYAADGARLQRTAIDDIIEKGVYTPLGRAHFFEMVGGPKDEWHIARAFLKWKDAISVSPEGIRHRAPLSATACYARCRAGQLAFDEATSDGGRRRLVDWSVSSFRYLSDVPFTATFIVDGQEVITLGDSTGDPGGNATLSIVPSADSRTLFFTKNHCDATQRFEAVCRTEKTDLFEISVADLVKAKQPPAFGVALDKPFGVPLSGSSEVIEYYNDKLDHFAYAIDPAEQRYIEAGGAGPGWHRIGHAFEAWLPGQQPTSSAPVCRFYGTPGRGPNSHFFTADKNECAAVRRDAGWLLESTSAFFVPSRDGINAIGLDSSGFVPRWYNGRFSSNDSNHRMSSNSSAIGHHCVFAWRNEGIVFPVNDPSVQYIGMSWFDNCGWNYF